MRVMVTGATTPIGAALVERLLAQPDVELVIAIGRERDAGRADDDPRLMYRSIDLTHQRSVHDLIWGEAHELGVDTVVCGMQHRAVADVGHRVHAQNVRAARELLLACNDHPTIHRFVYRSFAEVYSLRHTTSDLIDEESALDFDPMAPQWVRDRVEADLTVCAHLAGAVEVAVLRCAEVFAPGCGSQLWDYLSSRVCLRPLGFDPMLNVLSIEDITTALAAAVRSRAIGVFNIPGFDTLPLSRAIAESHRIEIPVPGPLLSPLYALRRRLAGFEFRYDLNVQRFHFGGVVDGTRAHSLLGYTPAVPVHWA